MQSSLLLLLLLCIVMAILGYYLGFVRPPRVMAWLLQSTFVIMVFMLIPIIVFVLSSQYGSEKGLLEYGITPYPTIIESVGWGNGNGENPRWMFEVDADQKDIIDFYSSGENTGDWLLKSTNDFLMNFEKENMKLTIAFRKDWSSGTLTYMITKK